MGKPVLKDDWELGETPVCSCGRLSSGAEAIMDEGWYLSWACEYCGPAMGEGGQVFEIPWPYGKDDFATPKDLEELGFYIV